MLVRVLASSDVSIGSGQDLSDALNCLNTSGQRVVLVNDASGKLAGIITDGDVRQALLRGATVHTPIIEVMNSTFVSAPEDVTENELIALSEKHGVSQIPCLDKEGKCTNVKVVYGERDRASIPNIAVIMAGGRGQRLRPFTDTTPKPLISVGESTLLDSVLDRCERAGFRHIYISVNYLAEKIVEHVGVTSSNFMSIDFLRELEPLGTAGSLTLLPKRPAEPFLVMNADILHAVNLEEVLKFHSANEAAITVCARSYETKVPFGVLRSDQGRVHSIEEKPTTSHLINAGIYVLSPEILDLVPTDTYTDMPSLIESAIRAGFSVLAYPIHEFWLDVGTLESLEEAKLLDGTW